MTYNPFSALYRTFPAIIDPDNTENSLASQIPKTVLFDILERLKALEDNPGTGTTPGTGGDAKWGSITGDLKNQTDLSNKLGTKADAATVTSELANKADKSTVTAELAKKADTATVITDLAAKADAATVTTELAKKADKTTVDEALAKKADTTTVNSALTAKADSMMVTSELAKKADKTTVDAALAKKADTDTVNGQLATKADTATVNAALATKADTAAVNVQLDTKADKATVDAALATKADAATVTTELAKKADTTTVNASLDTISNRVKELEDHPTTGTGGDAKWGSITGDLKNQTDLNAVLVTKADTVTVNASLATKADTATVNTALDTKADTAIVNAALDTKANAATVTTELAKKADTATVNAALDTKAPSIDYDDKTLTVVNQGDNQNPLLTVRNKFYRSVLSTTQFIDGTYPGAIPVLPYNKGIGIHTVTENGDDSAHYRLDSFEFSLQAGIRTENSNIVNYMIPLQDLIDGVKLTDTSTGAPKFWYSGGYISKSLYPQKTQVSLGIASSRTLSLFLRSNETTPADHSITVTFTLYIATPL